MPINRSSVRGASFHRISAEWVKVIFGNQKIMDNVRKIEALIQIAGEGWLRFVEPVRVIEAWEPGGVRSALTEVDRLTRETACYGVGFVSYEAATAFGLAVHALDRQQLPLVWFGLFHSAHVDLLPELPAHKEPYELGALIPSLDRAAFDAAFARIKSDLADGHTYQVNYTFRVEGAFAGHARSLFMDLVEAQQGGHSAFIDLETHAICSASPELFFARVGTSLSTRPMKGTAARGRTLAEDRVARDELRASAKQRAENVMIVDMMRNDLGRVAEVGSVRVSELFAVERYPNVWQMTSLVTARSAASIEDLFGVLHPSASVTGAPKVRTMEILRELENQPRGVYSGAIGYVAPDGSAHFNVAIRTAIVDRRSQRVSFGIGSGIVWDSEAGAEYDECLLKGSVLGRRPVPFDLLETMRWAAGEGFFLIERHLQRMSESAEYFGFPYDEARIREALEAVARTLRTADETAEGRHRVRLLLSRKGDIRIEHRPLDPSRTPLRVGMATEPVDIQSPFLFHKTTNRAMYERARSTGKGRTAEPGGAGETDETILWNARGEVTEATTANIVVELDGLLVTPPVDCGLLAGTCRAEALARGEARERLVTLDQLRRASHIWLINSVHGWRDASLVDPEWGSEVGGSL